MSASVTNQTEYLTASASYGYALADFVLNPSPETNEKMRGKMTELVDVAQKLTPNDLRQIESRLN